MYSEKNLNELNFNILIKVIFNFKFSDLFLNLYFQSQFVLYKYFTYRIDKQGDSFL